MTGSFFFQSYESSQIFRELKIEKDSKEDRNSDDGSKQLMELFEVFRA